MMRSRLRKPTSKSTTTTFCPACASAAPSAAVEVVLPTPPLPDVTTKTLPMLCLLRRLVQRCDFHDVAVQPGLGRPVAQRHIYFVRSLVEAVDRQQLRFDFLAINSRRRIAVDPRHGPPAQRAVNVDRSPGHDLRTGAD